MSTDSLGAIQVLVASGILTGLGYAGRAIFQRQVVRAQASHEEASAAEIVAGAAAELINPLRLELKTVRLELGEVHSQLSVCKIQLTEITGQLSEMQRQNEYLLQRNKELEAQR